MRTPSTANPAISGKSDGAAAETDALKRSSTHSVVKGETSPRLPHERDESSDSGTSPPRDVMRQAAQDLESGKMQTDRGEATDQLYARTLRGSKGDKPSN